MIFNSLCPTETGAPPDLPDPRTLDEPCPHRLSQLWWKHQRPTRSVMDKWELIKCMTNSIRRIKSWLKLGVTSLFLCLKSTAVETATYCSDQLWLWSLTYSFPYSSYWTLFWFVPERSAKRKNHERNRLVRADTFIFIESHDIHVAKACVHMETMSGYLSR